MEPLGSDHLLVGDDLLRLERQERRFHREVNQVDYVSWQQLLRRVRTDARLDFVHSSRVGGRICEAVV